MFAALIRHGLVGCIKTAAAYALFALGIRLGWHHQLALVVASAVVTLTCYRWHAGWVFDAPGWRGLLPYLAVCGGIYALNAALLALGVHLGLRPLLAQALAMVVSVPTGFATLRWVVFRRRADQEPV